MRFHGYKTGWVMKIVTAVCVLAVFLSSAFAAEKPQIFVQTGHATPVEFLVVDKNERYLVSAEDSMGRKYLKIWEISSGKEIRTIEIHRVRDVYFTDSEKFVVVSEKSIEIYNIHGEKIEKIDLPTKVNDKIFITKNREFFYTIGVNNRVHFYDIKDGSEIKIPEAEKSSGALVSLGFGFSGVFFINKKAEYQYVIYDENLKLRSKGIFKGLPSNGKIDPNSKFFYEIHESSVEEAPIFRSYSLDTGELLCSINLRKPIPDKVYPENREFLRFSVLPDSRIIFDYSTTAAKLGTGENKKLSVIEILDNCMYKEKNYTLNNVTSYVFSNTYPGFLIHGHYNGNIKMLDLNTGTEIKSFGVKPVIFGHIYSVDDKLLNMETEYSIGEKRSTLTFNLWNIKEGKLEKSESSSTGIYKKKIYDEDIKGEREKWFLSDPDVYYSKIPKNFLKNDYKKNKEYNHISQGHIFIFESKKRNYNAYKEGHALVLYNPSTKSEIAKLYAFTDGEWVVITPEGYFNASPNGAKHLNVRVGNNVYSIDNFYEKFFNPVYVASVLQGKKVEAVADIRKGILTPPDVRITSPAPGKEFSTDTLTVTVAAKDTGGGIDEIRLYHNGKAIGEDTRAVKIVPKGNEAIKTYTVTLVEGVNTFRAVGFSKDRTESNPYELVVKLTAPSKDVSLYVFAVGINKYKNPALNLNYAEPDARGITDFFKQQGKGLFKNVEIREIYNEQATKENIVSKLSQLQNINPQDAVLIYLAGHGENINDKWYFIPHELTYPEREEDVKTKGISSDELSGYMKNIKAQKILLLIDACKSGAVLVAFRGFEDRKALSQLSRSTGTHIIAASTKEQFAAEVKELGHGVFTYTLLEGLKGKAAGKGETVTVLKLKAYVDEQLPEITKKYKQEAQYTVGDSRGMDFPLVIAK
jgi:WD40 repeat protein